MDKETMQMIVGLYKRRERDAELLKRQLELAHARMDNFQQVVILLCQDAEGPARKLADILVRGIAPDQMSEMLNSNIAEADQFAAVLADLEERLAGMPDETGYDEGDHPG